MKIPNELPKLIAMLEGLVDRAAVELICSGGALNFTKDESFSEALGSLEDDYHVFAETIEKLSDTDENAVHHFVVERCQKAYLLGMAVGRRLGSAPLASTPRARKAVA